MSDGDFARAMERVERLIEDLEASAPAATLEPVRELLRAVLDAHGSGLKALLEMLGETARERDEQLRALSSNPSVSALLLLHDLHPDGDLSDGSSESSEPSHGNLIPVERLHSGRGGARA